MPLPLSRPFPGAPGFGHVAQLQPIASEGSAKGPGSPSASDPGHLTRASSLFVWVPGTSSFLASNAAVHLHFGVIFYLVC